MITFLSEGNNPLSQKSYDSFLISLQFHQLTCSCGHSGCLHVHGYYKRKVKELIGSFMLRVCRVKCSECGKTHSILPSSLIPYSQLPLVCCCRIASALDNCTNVNSVCDEYPDVDENNVKSVIRRYRRHWKQRLLSERIRLNPIKALIISCFTHYSIQFMQVHRTVNRIYLNTT